MKEILTPITTQLLVSACREAGYIEHKENYPLVAEQPDSFVFVCKDPVNGDYIVSKFWKAGDWNYTPYATCETFADALVKFNEYLAQSIQQSCKIKVNFNKCNFK
ncbi:MAG: hypothetical protein CMF61_03380 [Magnetococcales bacterium]|nr:hypothetical protein [Magnetococcales bacterium]